MKTTYLKCIRFWSGTDNSNQIGEKYRIDGKNINEKPYFSGCTWDQIIKHRPSGFLEEITEEEYYNTAAIYEIY